MTVSTYSLPCTAGPAPGLPLDLNFHIKCFRAFSAGPELDYPP